MTDFSRLQEWVNDYFPESVYSSEEIEDYLSQNVPAWNKGMSHTDKAQIIGDWEQFIAETQIEPQLEEVLSPVGKKSSGFWDRIKGFLKRFF